MNARFRYLLQRIQEAGFLASLKKVEQKLRPFAFWPTYFASGLPKTGDDERRALRDFGACCVEAFRSMDVSGGKDYAKRAVDRRALALAPDWKVLGYGNIEKPNGMGWHRDALHDHDFAPLYFPRADFLANGTRCDVKITWELNRLQWLLWHAEAIACGPESFREAHRNAALATIDNWIGANPVGYGVNWVCGMEVAIRGTILAITCGVLACDLDDAETDQLTGLLRAHQKFLARFPEISDVPGNHYLADLMGEVVLHVALDGLYAKVAERAIKNFSKAADVQFDADGCHIERSTIYHRLTLEIVALPYALALRAGYSSSPALASVVKRAAFFLAQVADDSGVLPVIGDQDSGFVIWFGEAAQQVDARLCGAPGAPDTDLYGFLAGLSASPTFFPKITREDGVRSGFGTLSGAGFRATLKTGPIGLQGRAAHDHDDALCVTVSHGAAPLLIDPGCHSYTLDPAIRRETIVSSRHNAPAPATRERHAPSMGSINATVRGAPTAGITAQTAYSLSGHLARTPTSGMALTRELRINWDGLEITDHWCFDSAEGARLLWLLHPDWRIEMPGKANGAGSDMAIPSGGLTLMLVRGDTRLTARLTAPEGTRLAVVPERFSPDYGAWATCPALRLTMPPAPEGRAGLGLTTAS